MGKSPGKKSISYSITLEDMFRGVTFEESTAKSAEVVPPLTLV
jgi:hypothetical protein